MTRTTRIHNDVGCDDDTHIRTLLVDEWVSQGEPPAFIYPGEPTTPNLPAREKLSQPSDTGLVVLGPHDPENDDIVLLTQCYDCASAWPDCAGPLRIAARYGMWIAER